MLFTLKLGSIFFFLIHIISTHRFKIITIMTVNIVNLYIIFIIYLYISLSMLTGVCRGSQYYYQQYSIYYKGASAVIHYYWFLNININDSVDENWSVFGYCD